jgi:hypothetical protein
MASGPDCVDPNRAFDLRGRLSEAWRDAELARAHGAA